ELELAVCVALNGVAHRLPRSAIPHHHRPAAVFAFGNDPFEASVLRGMILDMHRETLVCRIQAWATGDRPTLQRAAELEPEVVVQPASRMLMHDEAVGR